MNNSKDLRAALGMAIAYFSCRGDKVFLPITPNQVYDFIVDEDGPLKKVKVKTTNYTVSSHNYYVSLTLKGGQRNAKKKPIKFDHEKVDYLFVVSPEAAYMIPSSDVVGQQSLTLGKDYDKYKI